MSFVSRFRRFLLALPKFLDEAYDDESNFPKFSERFPFLRNPGTGKFSVTHRGDDLEFPRVRSEFKICFKLAVVRRYFHVISCYFDDWLFIFGHCTNAVSTYRKFPKLDAIATLLCLAAVWELTSHWPNYVLWQGSDSVLKVTIKSLRCVQLRSCAADDIAKSKGIRKYENIRYIIGFNLIHYFICILK